MIWQYISERYCAFFHLLEKFTFSWGSIYSYWFVSCVSLFGVTNSSSLYCRRAPDGANYSNLHWGCGVSKTEEERAYRKKSESDPIEGGNTCRQKSPAIFNWEMEMIEVEPSPKKRWVIKWRNRGLFEGGGGPSRGLWVITMKNIWKAGWSSVFILRLICHLMNMTKG